MGILHKPLAVPWTNNQYSLGINTDIATSSTILGSTPILTYEPATSANVWQYLAGVYNGSQIINYLDASAGTPVAYSTAIPDNAGALIIGGHTLAPATHFTGS